MTFLSPLTALVTAAVAVPLLVVLYVLKLRRRRLPIASTLLWRRSFEDLQVNVPFQRLRLTALFALQLLMLLLLLLALAEPVITPAGGASASRILLLVDRSASMNAADVPEGTRLEAAKAAAREIVERLSRGRAARAVMVIAFGARPRLVTGFEARREVLLDAIASIAPTDEEADLAAALELAGTFGSRREQTDEEPPDVILVSDGGVAPSPDRDGFALRAGRFRFVAVGPAPPPVRGPGAAPAAIVRNVGIVALSARRDHHDPGQVLVFARLANAGAKLTETLVSLFVDDEPGPIRRLTLPAATDEGPGEATVTFSIELPAGAVLRVRHSGRDELAGDDTAAVVLPPPSRPRIVLVHGADGADPYLRDLLAEFEPRGFRVMTHEAFEGLNPLEVDLARRFDLAVFDGVAPSRLPGIPTVVFGAAPPGVELLAPGSGGARRILSWRRRHPIMRHVSLDAIVYAESGGLRLPPEATALATGPDGPVIAVLARRGAQHVVVGFPLRRSNWPTHVSVTVFMQNVLDYLTLSRTGASSIAVRPGEPVTARVAPDAVRVVVRGPDVEITVPAAPGATITLPALPRAGLYAVEGVEPPHDGVAVSVLSAVETDVRPRRTVVVNAERVDAGAVAETAPRGVWPWFAGAALALLVVEWAAYCRLLRV